MEYFYSMKRILFAILVILVSVSCSRFDCENDIMPLDGQYLGRVDYDGKHGEYSPTFCLIIVNGRCADFVIYSGKERFDYYRSADISTKGCYPNYTYRIDDFTLQARYSDSGNFVADLSGVLHTHKDGVGADVGGICAAMALEAKGVHFRLDNTPLDADNDGLLDCEQ